MSSAVIELQNITMNNSTDLSEALRRALTISTKLSLVELRAWVSQELEGYSRVKGEGFPDYRIIGSQLIAKNPFHGNIPYLIDDSRAMKDITTLYIHEPVQALTYLLKNRKHTLEYQLPHKWHSALIKAQGIAAMEVTRIVSPSSLESIIDRVRTRLLNFSLDLEAKGILGEGLSFSQQEKEKAAEMERNINIGVFQGILGDVTSSHIQQSNDINITHKDTNNLSRYLNDIGVSIPDIEQLNQAIADDNLPEDAKTFGVKVSMWIGTMVTKAASGAWDVGIAAAGNLLGEALKKFYGM